MNIDVISEYDMIWAKAKYSNAIRGIKPKLNDYGYIKIVDGKYPLIKDGVPLNFEIGKDYRTLIITGPNAILGKLFNTTKNGSDTFDRNFDHHNIMAIITPNIAPDKNPTIVS